MRRILGSLCLPALTFAAFAAGAADSRHDLYFQEALQAEHLGETASALARLQAARRLNRLQQDLASTDLALGRLYQAYRLPQLAADHYARVAGSGASASLRSEAWYRLAEHHYRHHNYSRAEDALLRAGPGLPYALEERRPFLRALIQMGAERNADASRTLNDWLPPNQRDPWTRYNLGVAELRQGKLLVGAGLLNSVGAMAAEDEEMLSLRDQANLALGYGFLRADQGATAKPLLQRVRLDGPYSNRALLGSGWVELAPAGTRQQNMTLTPVGCIEDPTRVLPQIPILRRPSREACDREKMFKQRIFFEQGEIADTPAERYRNALKPWQALIRRNPADPAVQEGLLAAAYAYSQLGQRDVAAEHYRQAIAAYEAEREQLDRAIAVVRSGDIRQQGGDALPWQSRVWALPRAEDAQYLQALLSGYSLPSVVADYRDLRAALTELEPLLQRLQALAPAVEAAAQPEAAPAPEPPPPAEAPPAPAEPPRVVLDFGIDPLLGLPRAPAQGGNAGVWLPDTESAPRSVSQPARRARPELQERQQQLQRRLQALRAELQAAAAAHERAIRDLALAELEGQRDRLETYLARARFSLARLLDPALTPVTP